MSTPQGPGQDPYGQDLFAKRSGDDASAPYGPAGTGQDPYGAGQYGAGPYGAGQYDPYGQPPSYPAAGYPGTQGYPGYPVQGEVQDPDSALGIVGLVLNFVCCGPVGLVVSWIALNKSKERGYKNTIAMVGAIIGGVYSALLLILGLIYVIIFVVALVAGTSTTALL